MLLYTFKEKERRKKKKKSKAPRRILYNNFTLRNISVGFSHMYTNIICPASKGLFDNLLDYRTRNII